MKSSLTAVVFGGILIVGSAFAQGSDTPAAKQLVSATLNYATYSPSWIGDSLREVTRQKVVASTVAKVAVAFLPGSGTVQGFGRDSVAGREEKRVVNPVNAILPKLRAAAQDAFSTYPDVIPAGGTAKVVIDHYSYSLLYTSKGENMPYIVLFESDASVAIDGPAKASFFKKDTDYYTTGLGECKFESDPRPLEEWQANEYAAVKALHDQVVEKCSNVYVSALTPTLENLRESNRLEQK